jgi:hypothetical protein
MAVDERHPFESRDYDRTYLVVGRSWIALMVIEKVIKWREGDNKACCEEP